VRIGLFLRNLDEEYQINVFRGIRTQARTSGADLVCVQGETLHPTDAGSSPFALAHEVRFDGVLVLSTVIVDASDGRKTAAIPRFLPAVPAVSIGQKVVGMVSLTLQSVQSLTRLMEHLVVDHGYRRFLFVGGPEAHPDNKLRERIFLQVLREFSSLCPEISWEIDHGGFFELSGMEVIRRHLGEPPFDAVVAANDNMALGIQKVLTIQADPRWRRCAVTGFDDISQALVSEPPLTTIHAPLEALGALALDTLVDLIRGQPATNRSVRSRLVLRGSCGCQSLPLAPERPVDRDGLEARLDGARRRVLETEQWLRAGNDFARELGAVVERLALIDRIDGFLTVLGVRHFFLMVGQDLWYERLDGVRRPVPHGIPLTTEALFSTRGALVPRPWDLCVFHLAVEATSWGVAVYSVDDNSLPHLASALPHVANAVQRIHNRSEQEDKNRWLEAMVGARTAELTRANLWLQNEVKLRRAAEAEVLQVSEFERQRFGLDLHDDICQRLAGLTMYLRGSAKNPPSDPQPLLAELGALVDETLYLTRQYAHASFPIDLETRGLDAVLRTLCETLSRQKGIPCVYSSDLGSLRAPLEGLPALNLFRIVQEALQNAARHAQATEVTVDLRVHQDEVVLTVADNGLGIPPRKKGVEGLGFRSMAYRAAQLGGRLAMDSCKGRGTVLTVTLPEPNPGSSL